MTKKTHPSEELSWDEAVSRYLEEHPDFFWSRQELLLRLKLPHAGRGTAISLLERQVEILRQRHAALEHQLQDLIAIARENDTLAERVHHFAGAMIDAGSFDDVVGTARELLRQEFRLDAVAVLLQEDADDIRAQRPEFVAADEPHFAALLRRCQGRRVFCGERIDSDGMEFLFGNQARDIQSLALIPVREPGRQGLLVLGSRDARRFHAEMGVTFLVRLGELFIRAAARFLRTRD